MPQNVLHLTFSFWWKQESEVGVNLVLLVPDDLLEATFMYIASEVCTRPLTKPISQAPIN